jgi:DHA1 family multidrug resistance protein-like MFS transporter
MSDEHDPSLGEGSTAVDPVAEQRSADRLVSRLSWVVLLEWMGAGVVLPLLPLYLRDHGISSAFVGVTMASFYLAGLCLQYPAGRLIDRIGRRPILIGGLLAYSAASLSYLFFTSAAGFIVLRFVQGAAAGAVEVASLALVSSAVPIERRGRATSRIYSAMFIGIFIGPVAGAAVGVSHMGLLFTTTAVLSILASIPVLTSKVIRAHDKIHVASSEPLVRIVPNRGLVGAVILAATIGLFTGVYESCWSLLMQYRHATQLQIGLSWAVFSLPYVFFIRSSGWLADHADRRLLALGGIAISVVMFLTWPHLTSPTVMILLNCIDALAYALVMPSAQSLLTQGRSDAELGRVQGLYATSSTAAIMISAAISGLLFGIAPGLPFTVTAPIAGIAVISVAIIWRKVPGRVSDSAVAGAAAAAGA